MRIDTRPPTVQVQGIKPSAIYQLGAVVQDCGDDSDAKRADIGQRKRTRSYVTSPTVANQLELLVLTLGMRLKYTVDFGFTPY